ncbi:MAG: cytochrome c3 family protein [Chloroflexota bacterium]
MRLSKLLEKYGQLAIFPISLMILLATFLVLDPVAPGPAFSEEVDCLSCHEDLKKEKVVHPAVDMGCATCHSAIDATDIPHKKTNNIAKGLSAEQPDLCYNCHDKAKFTKATVHAAVGMGCTGCHNPHSSKNARLLVAALPDLCYNCHDKAEFTKKNVHMPVASGECLTCHTPHSSDFPFLLNNQPLKVCLECHEDVKNRPHAIVGFTTTKGHPIGEPIKEGKVPDDPARPGKKFYCGSCHNPHSSDSPRLFRYKGETSFDLCMHCHKM